MDRSSGEPFTFSRDEDESKKEEECLERSSRNSTQVQSKGQINCFEYNQRGHYKNQYPFTKKEIKKVNSKPGDFFIKILLTQAIGRRTKRRKNTLCALLVERDGITILNPKEKYG